MRLQKVNTVSANVDRNEKGAVDLDQALSIAGLGVYNLKYGLVLSLFLIAAIVEPIGYSYILPASKCDLEMTDTVRGFIASIPYIGIVITSFPWGYLVDTWGRKMTVIYSSLAAGTFGVASAFMPNLITFIIFKFLTSLCLACPAAAPYTFIGEIAPAKYRDVLLSVVNALQLCGCTLVPLLAWAILPLDFKADFGLYYFRPWRLLTIVNSSTFLIAAFFLHWGPESPKYLMSRGRHEECLQVLRTMYAQNKNKSPAEFPVKMLKTTEKLKNTEISFLTSLKVQSLPLLNPPYLKWMVLNSTLMFGIFALINGLYMWLPDILNRLFSGHGEGTVCDVIKQRKNETLIYGKCIDTIDSLTFIINSVANAFTTGLAIIASALIRFIGKKVLVTGVYCIIGVFCILVNFVTDKILYAILLSTILFVGVAIGPVNAYTVEIFPTHLRGMAVGLSMMVGRAGSMVAANVAGVLLNSMCEATFYVFGGSLLFCSALSLLLPKTNVNEKHLITRL